MSEVEPAAHAKPAPPGRAGLVLDEAIPRTPSSVADAAKEAQGLADGSLAADAARNEHGRRENLRDVVHRASITLIQVLAAIAALGIIVVAFHWLSPPCMHFLTAGQLDKLEAVGTSAVFSGLLTVYGKKLVQKL